MTKRERFEAVLAGNKADRTPLLGGWLAAPGHIQELIGVSDDQYWEDPVACGLKASEVLQMDGLIGVFVPSCRDDFRLVDADSFQTENERISLEEVLAEIDGMPEPREIDDEESFEREYKLLRQQLVDGQRDAGDMVWMPSQWDLAARASWYGQYGYENFFCLVGMHQEQMRKLLRAGGAYGRFRSRLLARAIQEGLYPKAVLFGEDICTQRGPMIDPEFLEKYYAPELKRGLEPLLEVGCRPVWHCDGDVRLLLDMLIDCGVQGLQGFQPECGMTIESVVQRRTRDGGKLLIFGPLAVTTELPVLSPQQIRQKVRDAIEICDGNADLVLFTANTINPDIPLENIISMYQAAMEH